MKRLSVVSMCVVALVLVLGVSQTFAAGEGGKSVPRATKLAAPTSTGGGLHLLGGGNRSLSSYSPLTRLLSGRTRMGVASRSLALLSDDNIPGVELPLSADVSGTVDATTDSDDVNWFYLEAGAGIEFHLNAAPGSQLELYLYGPEATDVNTATPIAWDDDHIYPTSDRFVAPSSGYYFVDVFAKSGTSAYTMPYEMFESPDDDIPGTPVSASPIVRWGDIDWDWEDVSSLPLRAGDTLTMHLVADSAGGSSLDFDADLYLLGPSATSVAPHGPSNAGIIAASETSGTNEAFSYTATAAGTYYIDVATYSGYGASSLTWSVNPLRSSIARTAPSGSKLTYKRKKGSAKFTLGARLTDQFALPVKSVTAYLEMSTNKKTWKKKVTATTNSNGAVSVKVTAKVKGTVYFRWHRPASSTSTSAYTAAQKVIIK